MQALNEAARQRLRLAGELGDDVAIQTGRGARTFAAGDRVMFLQNERGMGVKNGSLGTVQSLTTARMAVMLDDGRHVAFDIKDYAQLDHGYAATVHKSQGVTVDRVHVLATPGLDRHAAYVALSRHRDSVDLHYGRDDFADQGRLVRTLSRERAKDMASDYTRDFGDRRQIRLPDRMIEKARSAPARDPFAGLDLRFTTPKPVPPQPAPDPAANLPDAVMRHGRIVRTMRFTHEVGDPYTTEQRAELTASRASVDAIVPHGARDLETAMTVDTRLVREASEGRTGAVIRAMQLETEIREDPTRRADVFVQRWQGLEGQRRALKIYHEDTKIRAVENTMLGMAKSLERDPQVESILRNRKVELGLGSTGSASVGRELADMIGRGRSRGLGIGM